MADVSVEDRERANLLALILERLLRRSSGPYPRGSYCLRAGAMAARIAFEDGHAVVRSGAGESDCEIEGSMEALSGLALGGSAVVAWWSGRIRWRGSPFRAMALAKLLRSP